MMHEEVVSTKGQAISLHADDRRKGDDLDLLELLVVVLRHKKTILASSFGLALFAWIILIFIPPSYTAEATFLPPNSMNSGSSAILGQLSALSGAGASLGGLKDPTQIYVGMLGSRVIADDLITQFDLGKIYKTKKLSQTEAKLKKNSDFLSGKDSIIKVSVTDHSAKRAADLANAYLVSLHKLGDRIAFTEAAQKRLYFGQQLEQEKDALADAEVELTKIQEQTGLILPGGQTRLQIETIAQTQAEIASREIEIAAMSQAATSQNPDVIRLRSEVAALKQQLEKLQNSPSSRTSGSIQIATARMPELTLTYVRKERDVKYHEALYELLLKQYESAKLDESRSAPLMQVVDYATVPDTKSGPHRMLLTLLVFVAGLFVGTVTVLLRFGISEMSQDPLSKSKLANLRAAAQWRI